MAHRRTPAQRHQMLDAVVFDSSGVTRALRGGRGPRAEVKTGCVAGHLPREVAHVGAMKLSPLGRVEMWRTGGQDGVQMAVGPLWRRRLGDEQRRPPSTARELLRSLEVADELRPFRVPVGGGRQWFGPLPSTVTTSLSVIRAQSIVVVSSKRHHSRVPGGRVATSVRACSCASFRDPGGSSSISARRSRRVSAEKPCLLGHTSSSGCSTNHARRPRGGGTGYSKQPSRPLSVSEVIGERSVPGSSRRSPRTAAPLGVAARRLLSHELPDGSLAMSAPKNGCTRVRELSYWPPATRYRAYPPAEAPRQKLRRPATIDEVRNRQST